MIEKNGLFLNDDARRYEIVGVRKVRRDYVPTGECEPLPFLTKGNLIVLGIDQRETLPVSDNFDGVIQKLTALDISRLRKAQRENEPKKWQPVLQRYIEQQLRYVREMAETQFMFESTSLDEQLMVQKRANLAWDDAVFANGIIYPLNTVDDEQPFIVIDLVNGLFRYIEGKRVEEMPIGVGIFGRMRHVKWPKPTATALKLIRAKWQGGKVAR
ncbi:MAG TPA: hypothetical protein ENJ56_02935 [Anaerolineae bacterium]|nr:hypothetical protein [Anaerolineae bacterium]